MHGATTEAWAPLVAGLQTILPNRIIMGPVYNIAIKNEDLSRISYNHVVNSIHKDFFNDWMFLKKTMSGTFLRNPNVTNQSQSLCLDCSVFIFSAVYGKPYH